jgi:hypothetical protein
MRCSQEYDDDASYEESHPGLQRPERCASRGQESFHMSGHSVHIKLEGRTYSGTYKVDRNFMTVTTPYGKKTAQLNKTQHAALAQRLLEELVQQEKARKGSTL